MGYGAVFSDDHRDDPNFDRADEDWQAILGRDDIAAFPDGGGRVSLHRKDTLLVATEDLRDRRIREHVRDLGMKGDVGGEEPNRLGVTAIELPPNSDVVATTTFLRSLGGRQPLRLGPDHVLFPMEGRVYGPATPPVPASPPPTTKALMSKARRSTPTVRVAVIDTGYIDGNDLLEATKEAAQPDALWDGHQLAHWVGGHGIHVAGRLAEAASGAIRIRHYNVSSSLGGVPPVVTDLDLATSIAEALDRKCRVINVSLGGPTALDLGLVATALVIGDTHGRRQSRQPQRDDAVIVASAGNEATIQPMFPAAMKGVIAVGSIRPDGTPSGFTNHGWWVDCATEGEDIVAPYVDGLGGPPPGGVGAAERFQGWAQWSGTSFAAPFVAGRIAAAMARGIASARIAAATVLSQGTPLDPMLGLGVRIS